MMKKGPWKNPVLFVLQTTSSIETTILICPVFIVIQAERVFLQKRLPPVHNLK